MNGPPWCFHGHVKSLSGETDHINSAGIVTPSEN